MPVVIFSAWNIAREGYLEITINGVVKTINGGHVSHVPMAPVIPGVVTLSTLIQAAIAPAIPSITCTFNPTFAYYTLEAFSAFTLAFPATPAGARARAAIGMMNPGLASAFSSTLPAVYSWQPTLDTRSNRVPMRADDASEVRVADDGTTYAVGPTVVPRTTSWEHTFEPKSRMFYELSGLRSWEGLWRHAGRYQEPCLITDQTDGGGGNLVFTLASPDFSERTHSLMQSDWDDANRIRIDARVRGFMAP